MRTHAPPNDHNQRQYQHGNLHAGPNSHTNRQVHFILDSNSDRCRVLSRVTDNREQNQTDESLRDTTPVRDRVNRINLQMWVSLPAT